MSTITAILEPNADGSLHLPLPKSLCRRKVKVTATLEPAEAPPAEAEAKLQAALVALGRLRELGTFGEITDSVAWQREIRTDRPNRIRAGDFPDVQLDDDRGVEIGVH